MHALIADSTVRLVNLQARQLDIIEEMSATDAAKLRADPRLKLVAVPGLGYMALGFNMANGLRAQNPFARDARLRAALEAAIDRDVINQVVWRGSRRRTTSPSCRRARSTTPDCRCPRAMCPVPARC